MMVEAFSMRPLPRYTSMSRSSAQLEGSRDVTPLLVEQGEREAGNISGTESCGHVPIGNHYQATSTEGWEHSM
jgi:hypothetical protein